MTEPARERPPILPLRGRIFIEKIPIRPGRKIVLVNATYEEVDSPGGVRGATDHENHDAGRLCYDAALVRLIHPDDALDLGVDEGAYVLVKQGTGMHPAWVEWKRDVVRWDRNLGTIRFCYWFDRWREEGKNRTIEDYAETVVKMPVKRVGELLERRDKILPAEVRWIYMQSKIDLMNIPTPDDCGAVAPKQPDAWRLQAEDADWLRTVFASRNPILVVPPSALLAECDSRPEDGEFS